MIFLVFHLSHLSDIIVLFVELEAAMSFVIIMVEKEVEKQFQHNKVKSKKGTKRKILLLYNLLRVSWGQEMVVW